MKKIMFEIVVLLIIALTGLASAHTTVSATISEQGKEPVSAGTYNNDDPYNGNSGPAYTVHEGQPLEIDCHESGATTQTASGYEAHFYSPPSYSNNLWGNYYQVSSSYPDTSGNAVILFSPPNTLTANADPYKIELRYTNINSEDGSEFLYLYVLSKNQTNIPEFPSIAIPVAAVLGLVAIIGRKKI
jgi:hypothetical protein